MLFRSREDPGAVITEHALAGDDALCAKALSMFVSIYGAEAGNLALKVLALGIVVSVYGAEAGNLALKALAVGGVVLAGGIAPRLMPLLGAGMLVSAFRDKGRLSSLMETIPVLVALNPKTALFGAARVALSLL